MAGEDQLVRLRELPGVGEVIDLCRNKRNFEYPTSSYTQEKIDVVSIRLFGITQRDTTWDAEYGRLSDAYYDAFDLDDDLAENDATDEPDDDVDENECDEEPAIIDYDTGKSAWEKRFNATQFTFPQSEPFWRAIGWDMSDGNGNELLCAHCFDRQIIATLGGFVPGAKLTIDGSGTWEGEDEAKEADLAERLKRDAEDFVQRKRSR